MSITFIVNPVAGTGLALQVEEQLKAEAERLGLQARFLRSGGKGEATELARQAAAEADCGTVVSVGGDGTSYEVCCGLLDSGKAMGIIPAGTGNDFIKTVGLPSDPVEALHAVLERPARPVDIGLVNGRPFLNVCGTGFDVMVLDCAEAYKQRFRGLLPYLLGLLKAIARYRPVHIRCTVDGQLLDDSVLICAVANGRCFGGGIPICPVAMPDDGRLDMVIVKNVPRWKIPFYLPGLLNKKVLGFSITEHRLCRQVHIDAPGMRVEIDGEIFSMDSVDFAIQPGRLMLHW